MYYNKFDSKKRIFFYFYFLQELLYSCLIHINYRHSSLKMGVLQISASWQSGAKNSVENLNASELN